MKYLVILLVLVLLLGVMWRNDELFVVGDSYLRPNYESGANMIRGDLPIEPVQQSWFNSQYGPENNYVQGFMNM